MARGPFAAVVAAALGPALTLAAAPALAGGVAVAAAGPASAGTSCSVVPGVSVCFDGAAVTLTDTADDGHPVAVDVTVGTAPAARTVDDRGYRSTLRFDVGAPPGTRVCVRASVVGVPPTSVARICRTAP